LDQAEIMVVDDDPMLRATLVIALEMEGYSTISAADGQEAYRLLQAAIKLPSLLILDLRMPIMTGGELLKRLNSYADPRFAKLPVLIATADQQIEPEVVALAKAVIRKPFDLLDFLNEVRRLLSAQPLK